MTPKSSLF